jgi:hypothetical protein
MPTLIFRCPSTGMNVQAWFAGDANVAWLDVGA